MNPDVHTLTGAYALDALDELERRQFERHLAGCPNCTQEVAELRATAARLGAAEAVQPPEALRARVLGQISTTRQAVPAAGGTAARRPPGRWTLWLTAAVVALVVSLTLGGVTVHTRHQLDTAQGRLAQAQTWFAPLAAVLSAPDVRVSTGAGTSGGTAAVAASRSLDEAVLLGFGMPTPPAGRTLQAWVMGTGNPRSIGLVQPDADAAIPPVVFRGLTGPAEQIGLTVEPTGGSPRPTTAPLMLFTLAA